jgi:hypothetical protein
MAAKNLFLWLYIGEVIKSKRLANSWISLNSPHPPPYTITLIILWNSRIFFLDYKLNPDPRTSSEFGLGIHEFLVFPR